METSSLVNFLMKWGWRGHSGRWGFWCQENHLACKVHAYFYCQVKEAVKFIEASNFIMSVGSLRPQVFKFTQILEVNNLMTKITIFWCFEKKKILNRLLEFLVKFSHTSVLWRTGMLLLTKSKGHNSNAPYSGFPNHLQTKSSLQISIPQNQIHYINS